MPRTVSSDGNLLAAAEAAHALVQTDPRRAADEAVRALGLARAAGDTEAAAAALHALGFARYELGDPRTIRTLRAAVRIVDRKSTRLNSSHMSISYAVFCLKKKKKKTVQNKHERIYTKHAVTITQQMRA